MNGVRFLSFSSAKEAYDELEAAIRTVIDLTSPNGIYSLYIDLPLYIFHTFY